DSVNKGFAIFRDPDEGSIKGWKGVFSTTPAAHLSPEKQFLIQPWSANNPMQVMDVESESRDVEELAVWVNEISPQEKAFSTDSGEGEFIRYVEFAKNRIDEGAIEKVVTARKKIFQKEDINPLQAFFNASDYYPEAFNYLLYHPAFGIWLG